MKRTLVLRRSFSAVVTICLLFLCGCGNLETPSKDCEGVPETTEYVHTTEHHNYVKNTIPVESTPAMQGQYTLEDCQGSTGIFIAYADGSFDRFYGGGFLDQDGMYNANGMFLRNDIIDYNPSIGKDDKLVLFCDSSYTFEMVPVNWETGVLYTKLEDGTRGYTRAIKHQYGVDFFTYYENYETVQNSILYIDGVSAKEYPFEIVQGGPKNTTGYGFPKGTTVKLGTQSGSAIIEEEYEVSATYFDCRVIRNIGKVSDDEYFLYPTPTTDGYAVINIYDGLHDREIPSGAYVLVLRMGRSYIAYLLNWENS